MRLVLRRRARLLLALLFVHFLAIQLSNTLLIYRVFGNAPILSTARNTSICVPWDHPIDDWWTHNQRWEPSTENYTHHCFRTISDTGKLRVWNSLYQNQFVNDCNKAYFREMWSSGFGADLLNVVNGLLWGLADERPFVIVRRGPWHYASFGNISTCSRRDMFCYFLNLTSCTNRGEEGRFGLTHNVSHENYMHAFEYATRHQTWVRKAIYTFLEQQSLTQLPQPCLALHVRRADVVLHKIHSRRYHAISEYLSQPTKYYSNILLLTDDANAIDEALHQYPDRNWLYIKRPRFRGAEGGFEKQIPSKQPKDDMVALLSLFRLVRQCETLVYSSSNLADLLARTVDYNGGLAINMDSNKSKEEIYARANRRSVKLSKFRAAK